VSSEPLAEDEVLGTRILLLFVGPTGRTYMAGGLIGPLTTEGQDEHVDPAASQGLGIKLMGIKVVLDD